jgi:hypothetical protein
MCSGHITSLLIELQVYPWTICGLGGGIATGEYVTRYVLENIAIKEMTPFDQSNLMI